jgi:hypothetical protein
MSNMNWQRNQMEVRLRTRGRESVYGGYSGEYNSNNEKKDVASLRPDKIGLSVAVDLPGGNFPEKVKKISSPKPEETRVSTPRTDEGRLQRNSRTQNSTKTTVEPEAQIAYEAFLRKMEKIGNNSFPIFR